MAKTEIALLIYVVLLGAIEILIPVNAECCYSTLVQYKCGYENGCETHICSDGTRVEGRYCGYGECNLFGCNCDGGCRRHSALEPADAKAIFSKKYGVIVTN